MAHGARVDSVVIFEHDLDRSVSFYTDVQEPLHELPARIYGW